MAYTEEEREAERLQEKALADYFNEYESTRLLIIDYIETVLQPDKRYKDKLVDNVRFLLYNTEDDFIHYFRYIRREVFLEDDSRIIIKLSPEKEAPILGEVYINTTDSFTGWFADSMGNPYEITEPIERKEYIRKMSRLWDYWMGVYKNKK